MEHSHKGKLPMHKMEYTKHRNIHGEATLSHDKGEVKLGIESHTHHHGTHEVHHVHHPAAPQGESREAVNGMGED